MGFRKTFRSTYFPPLSAFGFGEVKFSPASAGPSSRYVSRSFQTSEEISKSCLPLTSLSDVIATGQVIDGRVSFAPSDPARIDSLVHTTVGNYISTYFPASDSSSSNSSTDEN